LPRHAIPPVYKLSAHVALLFLRHAKIGKFEDAALVAEHGSWNCSQEDNARNAGPNIAEGMRV
jgi:glucose/arabinose dehydrogenase